jgi:hypothetical protein
MGTKKTNPIIAKIKMLYPHECRDIQQQPTREYSPHMAPTMYCTCAQQRCHCNARFKPDLLCIKELPHQSTPPPHPTYNLMVQFIEFTYTNDRFPQDTIKNKIQKYQPLINDITQQGWKIDPFIVITAGARGTTHAPSMKQLEQTFKLPKKSVNHTFKEINTIAKLHKIYSKLKVVYLRNHTMTC